MPTHSLQEIIEETFELQTGAPVSQVLLQNISRVAGALVENVGQKGKVIRAGLVTFS